MWLHTQIWNDKYEYDVFILLLLQLVRQLVSIKVFSHVISLSEEMLIYKKRDILSIQICYSCNDKIFYNAICIDDFTQSVFAALSMHE